MSWWILGQLHVVVIYGNVTNSTFLLRGSYIYINVASRMVWPLNFILNETSWHRVALVFNRVTKLLLVGTLCIETRIFQICTICDVGTSIPIHHVPNARILSPLTGNRCRLWFAWRNLKDCISSSRLAPLTSVTKRDWYEDCGEIINTRERCVMTFTTTTNFINKKILQKHCAQLARLLEAGQLLEGSLARARHTDTRTKKTSLCYAILFRPFVL